MILISVITVSACDRITTQLDSACHSIDSSADQKTIVWENAKSQASIDSVVTECLPLKDAAAYKLDVTANVTSRIDDVLFPLNSPLTDAISFEAISAKGVVIEHEQVAYTIPRLIRSEKISVSFKDLSASEISAISKAAARWAYQ
jgi:hypothetical protein